jgi:hypothetical protein
VLRLAGWPPGGDDRQSALRTYGAEGSLDRLSAGEVLDFGDVQLTLGTDIPKGHKVAVRDIAVDAPVLKFGFRIGHAIAPIKGPKIRPNGKKNIPTTPPMSAPQAPHLLPPNHFAPAAPLKNSKTCDNTNNITRIKNDHQRNPEASPRINRCATAASRRITCPGRIGIRQPMIPTNNKLPVTNQASACSVMIHPAPCPIFPPSADPISIIDNTLAAAFTGSSRGVIKKRKKSTNKIIL